MKNVLVTSISKKIPLITAVKEAMDRIDPAAQLIGADLNPNCLGRSFADHFWEMPRLNDLTVGRLISFCHDEGIGFIFPTRDGELSFFSGIQKTLEENGIAVMVSKPEAVRVCLDKLAFYESLSQLGYPVIPTSCSIEQIDADRFVVKDRFGAGSANIGLDLSRSEAAEYAKRLSQPVFQPFIDGREASVDIYATCRGKVKGCVARMRDVVVNGESQVTTTFRDLQLERLCSDIACSLGLYGHVLFQVIVNENGGYSIIECNARFGGASTLSVAAGLDSFYWFFLESTGGHLDDVPFRRSPEEKRLIRYPKDLIV